MGIKFLLSLLSLFSLLTTTITFFFYHYWHLGRDLTPSCRIRYAKCFPSFIVPFLHPYINLMYWRRLTFHKFSRYAYTILDHFIVCPLCINRNMKFMISTHTQNKKTLCINQCMNINLGARDLFLDFLLSLVWSSSDEWEAVDASESLGLSSSSITASKCSSTKDSFFMDATGCKARYSADVSSTSKSWRQNKKEKRHHRLYRLKVLVCFYDTCSSNTYISGR